MKVMNNGNSIEITNYPKTICGIICAAVLPILSILIILDLFSPKSSKYVTYEIIPFFIMMLLYGYWLTHDFYTTILRHKIIIDEHGITEERLFGKSKHIVWNELEEYTCEQTAAPYRTQEAWLMITFRSYDSKTVIQTCRFPERYQIRFQSPIFEICDRHITVDS